MTSGVGTPEAGRLAGVRAALFDIDGTLIDSNDAHAEAWVQALAESGRSVPIERVRPLIGMGGDKLLPALTGLAKDSPEGQRISKRRRQIFKEQFLPTLTATRGARALLQRLRAQGLRLAVATSADPDEVGDLLRQAGVSDLIQSAASADDGERSKPDPDIVQAALASTGCGAAEAIMVGDTPYDVEAAARAGVAAVALRCGGWWGDEALAGALLVCDDPAELLALMPARGETTMTKSNDEGRLVPHGGAVTPEVGDEGGTPGDLEITERRGPATGSEGGETWRPADEPRPETIVRDETGVGRRSP
jgi:HAD superfamily hydrolase (TIGR01549 family)